MGGGRERERESEGRGEEKRGEDRKKKERWDGNQETKHSNVPTPSS